MKFWLLEYLDKCLNPLISKLTVLHTLENMTDGKKDGVAEICQILIDHKILIQQIIDGDKI